jgi:hypothetical protein
MGIRDMFKDDVEDEEEGTEMIKKEQPIKVQMIEPTRDGGPQQVSHPREITVNIKWKKGEEVKLEDLTFDFHSTEIKTVCWGLDGEDKSNCFRIGYCEECRVLFIIDPVSNFSDWRLDIFDHLFFLNEEFRNNILEQAIDKSEDPMPSEQEPAEEQEPVTEQAPE